MSMWTHNNHFRDTPHWTEKSTFEEGAEFSNGPNRPAVSVLTNGHLHVGQRDPTQYQHDEERDEECSWG